MGARAIEGSGHRLEAADGLKPASIYLDEASVTGTETALLAAAAAPGVTEIRHAACEPHVVELCEFLRSMGVGITGEGTHDDSRRRRRQASAARSNGCGATTSRRAAGRSSPRSPAAKSKSAARGRGHGSRRGGADARCTSTAPQDGDVFRVEQSQAGAAPAASPPACGRASRATWSASSPCSRRRPRAQRWCTTGCTSCGCSRSSR